MAAKQILEKPKVFSYEEYTLYLNDLFDYFKKSRPSISMREIAKASQVSTSNLSMILSGKRTLSLEILEKLAPHLGLSSSEQSYLRNLVLLKISPTQESSVAIYNKMNRFQEFRNKIQTDAILLKYLTHWYYVAIREMSALPSFSNDPKWVQTKLLENVPVGEIVQVLKFLFENHFIEEDESGNIHKPEKLINAESKVGSLALAQFHREMLKLAGKSIENTPREDRKILGYTMALNSKGHEEVNKILERAYSEIIEVSQHSENQTASEKVHHLEMALFPLTK